jgi:t-SNARE complex subunit (syntaxin)
LSPIKKKHELTAREETDLRLRHTQISSQSTRFYNIWNDYNDNQIWYRDQSKRLLVKQCKILGNTSMTNDQIETMIDEGNTSVFATSILDEERLARHQLTELTDRHDEFIKVCFYS